MGAEQATSTMRMSGSGRTDGVPPPLEYRSCAGEEECGVGSFPLSPQAGTSSELADLAKNLMLSLPIYGNWCGPGHPKGHREYGNCDSRSTPPAINELDSCCCKHDQTADSFSTRSLVVEMKYMNPFIIVIVGLVIFSMTACAMRT